jgi:hypothetical protein
MNATATFGQGTAVHTMVDGKALCGAGVSRAAGTGITKVAKPVYTDAEATCKRCAKFAAGQPAVAPAPSAKKVALQAPVPANQTTAWCHICDHKVTGTVAEIRDHVRNCKG